MNDLHPHWESTDGCDYDPTVPSPEKPEKKSVPIAVASTSRRPAAFVGILFVVGFVFLFFFEGVERITAQLSSGTEILITSVGLEPLNATVNAGEIITWRNDQDMPHIIQSDELCQLDGTCLFTATMFRGDTTQYELTADILPGTYTYYSATDPDMSGTIDVVGEAVALPPAVEPVAPVIEEEPEILLPPTAVEPVNVSDVTDEEQDESEEALLAFEEEPTAAIESVPPPPPPSRASAAWHGRESADLRVPLSDEPEQQDFKPAAPPANIPVNPYTVESGRVHPFGATGGVPVETLHGAPPAYGYATGPADRQPETGAGMNWLVSILSLIGFYALMRRKLACRTE